MATVGDDCYFFFTSSCSKGPSCPFRHVEAAKACKIICQHWQRGGCYRPMCMFRHSDFKVQVDVSEVPCYWETQPIGCRKSTCAYKHMKPRPTNTGSSIVSTDAGTVSDLSQTVTTSSPAVKPVIIEPESEDSIASPEKRPQPTETITDNSEKGIGVKKAEKCSKAEEVEKNIDEADKQPTEPIKKKIKKKIVKVKAAAKVSTPKTKKVLKKVPVKKKKVVVSEAEGKKKKQVMKKDKKKSTVPAVPTVRRKTVKERLGTVPTAVQAGGSVSDDSGSDSDDSIENIKVMSVEEILRQKALESMMRKKAAEVKSAVPQSPAVKTKGVQKTVKAVAPKRKVPLPPSSSEEEEGEEEEESEESPSSDDSSESDSSSSSDNPDVRRVIVDVESEKAARKRAKASLMKKRSPQLSALHSVEHSKGGSIRKAKTLRHAQTVALQKKKIGKKRPVNMDVESLSPVQKSVSIRERLGLPVTESKGGKDGEKVPLMSLKLAPVTGQAAASRRKTVLSSELEQENKGDSADDDGLEGIKVKTLEEIRQEKMKKLATRDTVECKRLSPVRQRLGLSKAEGDGGVENEERQVLLVTEVASQGVVESVADQEVPKKVRRRPWRSQKLGQPEAAVEKEDQRMAVVTSVISTAEDNYQAELDEYKQDRGLDESPFESLKRRALLKKMQAAKIRRLGTAVSSGGDADVEVGLQSPGRDIVKDVQEETCDNKEEEEDGGLALAELSNKKHKHKRKSKHHKKSKMERQIYMPPALKNSVSLKEPLSSLESVHDPVSEAAKPAPTQTVPPVRRAHHPIAAAWAAGLSLSAKGTGKRPVEAVPTVYTEPIPPQSTQRVQTAPRENKTAASSDASGVTIKSFSEIMAEKRRRRLEQAQEKAMPACVAVAGTEREERTSPLREDTRPRLPITPIVFNSDKSKTDRLRSQTQPEPVYSMNPSTRSIPPTRGQQWNSSQSVSQVADSKMKSQKKLFKKKSKSDLGPNLSRQNAGSLSKTSAHEEASSLSSTSTSLPASQSTVSSSTSLSLSSDHLNQSGREAESVFQNDGSVPSTTTNLSPSPPASVDKHRSPLELTEPSHKKSRSSLDDEFGFLDADDDFTPSEDVLVGDVEPIDDLLQDIDDLLA